MTLLPLVPNDSLGQFFPVNEINSWSYKYNTPKNKQSNQSKFMGRGHDWKRMRLTEKGWDCLVNGKKSSTRCNPRNLYTNYENVQKISVPNNSNIIKLVVQHCCSMARKRMERVCERERVFISRKVLKSSLSRSVVGVELPRYGSEKWKVKGWDCAGGWVTGASLRRRDVCLEFWRKC